MDTIKLRVMAMSRGGLVYVKRDLSNEEAPKTFSTEEKNPLFSWIEWTKCRLAGHPQPPPSLYKNGNTKSIASARALFLGVLDTSGVHPVSDWDFIIKSCAPSLGMPWEGVSGSRYPEAKQSWLLAGLGGASHSKSGGWLEWACASIQLSRQNSLVAEVVLPSKTIIDPWDPSARGAWAYDILDCWLESSTETSLLAGAFDRWTALVHEIDKGVSALPSSLGLPFHWQVAARQAEACLMKPPFETLTDIGPLPPIHSEIKPARGKAYLAWAGTSEWITTRFARNMLASGQWDSHRWDMVCAVIEADFLHRTPDSSRLLMPCLADLKDCVGKLVKPVSKPTDQENQLFRQALISEIEARTLKLTTPKAPNVSRAMRL